MPIGFDGMAWDGMGWNANEVVCWMDVMSERHEWLCDAVEDKY